MKKVYLLLLAALFATVSCDIIPKTDHQAFIETTGVSFDKTSLTIYPGDWVKIEATVSPSDATSTYKIWTSSNDKVATVDGWGRVSGVAPGECIIKAKTDSGACIDSCKVTVLPIDETSVSIDPTKLDVYYDETGTVTATVEPSNATYKTVTWASADETIATIDETGKVKGTGLGTTTITATTKNGLTATCTVTVSARMPTEPETLDLWKSDKAGFRGLFGAASDEGQTAGTGGWLKFENGAATWAANETGKIRTATLTLSTGSSITITQLGGQDFLGAWTVKSRLFNPNGGVPDKPKGTTGAANSAVTLAAVSGDVETLDGHENAFELSGLYNDAKMKVAFDIDYDAKTVKMGLFFDKRSTQLAKEGVYCAFIPELEGSRWGNYNFAPATFGKDNCNYEWMWLTSEDFNTFRYTPHTQYIVQGTSNLMLIGIVIQVSDSPDPVTIPSGNNPVYDTIYQANYDLNDTAGLSIFREPSI